MALPKRRVNHTRTAKRRTHYKATLPMPIKGIDGIWRMPKSHQRTSITKGLSGKRYNSDEEILQAIKAC